MSKKQLRPYGDKIIVTPIEEQVPNGSVIIIPESAKEAPQVCTIVALGEGRELRGISANQFAPFNLKVGDTLIISKYGGAAIKFGGKDYKIICSADIMAVIEEAA